MRMTWFFYHFLSSTTLISRLFCHYFPPWMVNWSRCPQVENSETMEVISFNCGTCIRLPVPWKWAQTLRETSRNQSSILQGLFFLFQGGYWFILWSARKHDFIEAVIIMTRNSENKTVCSVYTKSSMTSFLLIWRGFHSTIFFGQTPTISHEL